MLVGDRDKDNGEGGEPMRLFFQEMDRGIKE